MSDTIPTTVVPTFARGMRFRFDEVRQAWVVLGPERLFSPDEHATEVLKLVDGARSFGAIVEALAARFDAPNEVIAEDVSAMLRELADKGAVTL